MGSTQRLMKLIRDGDAIAILAEDSLIESFTELLKNNLIDIVDDKVILTPKAEKALNMGLDITLPDFKTNNHSNV